MIAAAILGIIALFAAIHLTLKFGIRQALGIVLFFAITVAPFRIFGTSDRHAGVTAAGPVVYTYTAILAVGVLIAMLARTRLLLVSPVVFSILVICWAGLFWGGDDLIVAGLVHFISAAAVWMVVQPLASSSDPDRKDRVIATAVLSVALLQVVVVLAQLVGINVPVFGGAASVGGLERVTGTFGHPGTLGKAMVLLLVLVLPSTRSDRISVRRIAWASIVMLTSVTGLTVGRANIAALVATLALWFLLDRQLGVGRRIRGLLLVVIAISPFIGAVLTRFDDDPTGGARPQLTAEALTQIGRTLFEGTGANRYVETVGRFGPATAAGFPVHNAFLLLIAELGIALAVIFLWSYFRATQVAFVYTFRSSSPNPYARALIAGTPGTVITLVTGWGLVGDSMLFVVTFVYAYLHASAVFLARRKSSAVGTVRGHRDSSATRNGSISRARSLSRSRLTQREERGEL